MAVGFSRALPILRLAPVADPGGGGVLGSGPGPPPEGGGGGGGDLSPPMILARGGYPPHQTAEQCFF